MSMKANNPKRSPLPCLAWKKPRCQFCGCGQIRTRRSVRVDGESSHRWVTCEGCKKNFVLIME